MSDEVTMSDIEREYAELLYPHGSVQDTRMGSAWNEWGSYAKPMAVTNPAHPDHPTPVIDMGIGISTGLSGGGHKAS